MLFSSLIFLYGFLPLFLGTYFLVPARARNGTIIGFSLFFYAWGEPVFAGVLLVASLFVFLVGNLLPPEGGISDRARKAALFAGIASSIGLLAYFKYANFAVHLWDLALIALHQDKISWTNIALPIGISFFTFQKISYLVDVYRGTSKPARHFADFLLFVMLFPQLIAGPIVRYHEIAAQIVSRNETRERILLGMLRFVRGLASKVLLANPLGQTADRIFALPSDQMTAPHAWLGLATYTLQIYFDFAGYSDMALGLARIVGFDFPENFARPYQATSVTDFWRRWHISLSSFMREYLYLPLGGNRCGKWRTTANLWFVFLVSGFWHGANWTFIAWGAYHGLLLSIERLVRVSNREIRLPVYLKQPITLLLVGFGWILFRCDTLHQAWNFVGHLFTQASPNPTIDSLISGILPRRTLACLLIAGVVALIPLPRLSTLTEPLGKLPVTPSALGWVVGTVALIVSTAVLASQSYNPFIYFRF